MYYNDQLKKDLEIARSWDSKRWTAATLCWKRAIWFLFYKRKNVRWCLPGPTSTSHPFGNTTPFKKEGDK